MSLLAEQIFQTVEVLPTEDQQQVLSFVEFLWTKRREARAAALKNAPQSFFDVAQALIGAGEGSGDISTNPDYMQGYGQ
ncbi:DUF2281 domain-containing protein [Pseudanabaena sp. BC1403]|uniref:DUF2281 domain-containing protein n=1 Tax=Pseudanabaena sp. BC1403 TaxID=2043171 RepID=UPI000CD925CC|nr:DUF2281 domain-containing protein [Pseudanabaena sp. BC1403]